MDPRPIGIYDSGLGGLTVAREVASALPGETIHYVGDTARCPYGPRPLDDVRRFVLQVGAWLAERDVKLLVVACNTGTAAGLQAAREAFDIPVIGVIGPGARAAVRTTVNDRIGVIATVGTIESGAYSRAIRSIDPETTVFSVPTPKFVDIAEAGLRMGPGTLEEWLSEYTDVFVRPSFHRIARSYLQPLKDIGVDTLVLGCTHFPLLSSAIGSVMGSEVTLISSAEETAREVATVLAGSDSVAEPRPAAPRHLFATTGDPDEFRRLGARVLRRPIGEVESIALEDLERLMPVPTAERSGPCA